MGKSEARLPRLGPLRFLVIQALFDGPQTGERLRAALRAQGAGHSRPSFCRLMQRMQAAHYVLAKSCVRKRGQQVERQQQYRLTDYGLMVWQATREFYAAGRTPPSDLKTVATETALLARLAPQARAGYLRRQRREMHRRLRRALERRR